jgi:hypothetical protein
MRKLIPILLVATQLLPGQSSGNGDHIPRALLDALGKAKASGDSVALEGLLLSVFQSSQLNSFVREALKSRYESEKTRLRATNRRPERLRDGSARLYRQTTNSALNSGSTSAVAKSSAAEFLSFALESGGLTGEVDKGAATIGVNALPIWQFMSGQGAPYGCGVLSAETAPETRKLGVCETAPGLYLRGLSASVSLRTNSRDTLSPASASNLPGAVGAILRSRGTLSALGFKYEFFQRQRGQKELKEAVLNKARALRTAAEKSGIFLSEAKMAQDLVSSSFYDDWLLQSMKLLETANTSEEREGIFRFRATRLVDLIHERGEVWRVNEIVGASALLRDYSRKEAELDAENLFRKAFTFDFVHQRPTDQPWLNQFRIVLTTPLGKKHTDQANDQDEEKSMKAVSGPSASLDFNAGVTIYHSAQMLRGKSIRLRDARAALSLNYRLPAWGEMGTPILSLAGYYQYMFENGVIQFNSDAFPPGAPTIGIRGPASEVLNTRGSIGLGQLRFEIPLGADSGVTLPLAVSYSNRLELLNPAKKNFLQGQIGISYDLSKLQDLLMKNKKPKETQ